MQGYFKWVLENGKSFNSMSDIGLKCCSFYPKIVEQVVKNECYNNSMIYCLEGISSFRYYEGYYLFKDIPFPIEHAFNTARDSSLILDFTSYVFELEPVEYFGVHIPDKYLREYTKKKTYCSPLLEYYKDKVIKKEKNETKNTYN